MQIDLSQFRATFFEETAEHLGNLETDLLRLEGESATGELLNDIFRYAHTIKGASGSFGFPAIARFTHVMESVLDRMRDGVLSPSRPLVELLLRATDVLKTLLTAAKAGDTETPADAALEQELKGWLEPDRRPESLAQACEPHAANGEPPAGFLVTFLPGADVFRSGMDPLLILRDLADLGTVTGTTLDADALPALADMDPESCYIGWSLRLLTARSERDVRDVFAFVEDSSRITIEPLPRSEAAPAVASASPAPLPSVTNTERRAGSDRRAASAIIESSSIRVPVEKVDRLVDLVGEVIIAQAMLTQALDNFSPQKLAQVLAAASELGRNTRELQERVMAIRMVPVANTFSRFSRLVHDLASSCGKQVTLEISGGDTEVDKGVIELIADPVMHLIRNAVDHGIEPPAERLSAGKPQQGIVHLRAFHQSGAVVIEVSDDGRGLNTARIREKAVERGLVRGDEPLTDEQIHGFIFHPGFSTAAVVSDVSGRGVGMDVVKRNVDSLNGSISIVTESGRGTAFLVKLPLTLAILDGLQIAVGDEIFVVPLLSIVETFRPSRADVHSVSERGEVVVVRGEALPLVRLHHLLDVPPRHAEPWQALVVLIENEGQRYGLLVDELLGQSQVVIKSIESNYRKVDGVMGATILGDGRVAFILDVQGLLRLRAKGATIATLGQAA